MGRRSILILAIALAAGGALSIVAWDVLKPDRRPPQLAATDARATAIVVEKQARRLTLRRGDKILAIYQASLGSAPIGHKEREGDGRTPEGLYSIDFKHPRSRFHLALRISYPNGADRSSARRRGVAPGGDIMIHGLPNGLGWLGSFHLARDWTDGCIAVTNGQIEEIWALVDVGTPVEIKP
jgi:murein L,D-transpeptidase YafK